MEKEGANAICKIQVQGAAEIRFACQTEEEEAMRTEKENHGGYKIDIYWLPLPQDITNKVCNVNKLNNNKYINFIYEIQF